jgi:hypothetical protein
MVDLAEDLKALEAAGLSYPDLDEQWGALCTEPESKIANRRREALIEALDVIAQADVAVDPDTRKRLLSGDFDAFRSVVASVRALPKPADDRNAGSAYVAAQAAGCVLAAEALVARALTQPFPLIPGVESTVARHLTRIAVAHVIWGEAHAVLAHKVSEHCRITGEALAEMETRQASMRSNNGSRAAPKNQIATDGSGRTWYQKARDDYEALEEPKSKNTFAAEWIEVHPDCGVRAPAIAAWLK